MSICHLLEKKALNFLLFTSINLSGIGGTEKRVILTLHNEVKE